MLYELISGINPFASKFRKDTEHNITKKNPDFKQPEWAHISQLCRRMVKGLLMKDPMRRLRVGAALKHKWLNVKLYEYINFQLLGLDTQRRIVQELMNSAIKIKKYKGKYSEVLSAIPKKMKKVANKQ